ncbi:Maltodextrin glucosidase [compost metagenome]
MVYAHNHVVVFARVYNQQRVLVAINRGEACEVVLDDSPLLNLQTWQLKEGKGDIQEGVLSLPAISASIWFGN